MPIYTTDPETVHRCQWIVNFAPARAANWSELAPRFGPAANW